MTCTWTVRDNDGRLLPQFDSNTQLEVERKLVPSHFDPFRLQVSSSYRELFDRTVKSILQRKGWQIVRRKPGSRVDDRITNNKPLGAAA